LGDLFAFFSAYGKFAGHATAAGGASQNLADDTSSAFIASHVVTTFGDNRLAVVFDEGGVLADRTEDFGFFGSLEENVKSLGKGRFYRGSRFTRRHLLTRARGGSLSGRNTTLRRRRNFVRMRHRCRPFEIFFPKASRALTIREPSRFKGSWVLRRPCVRLVTLHGKVGWGSTVGWVCRVHLRVVVVHISTGVEHIERRMIATVRQPALIPPFSEC